MKGAGRRLFVYYPGCLCKVKPKGTRNKPKQIPSESQGQTNAWEILSELSPAKNNDVLVCIDTPASVIRRLD
jgi:hypothetical protein